MRYKEDTNLKLLYGSLLIENDNMEDDDILAGMDAAEERLYLLGYNPNYKIPEESKTKVYKVDISSVVPGKLSQPALLKALRTIRVHTPPTWQYTIQNDINLPKTLKVGRNTVFKDIPAYEFDYNTVKDCLDVVGPLKMEIDRFIKEFNFTPTKVYTYLNYVPMLPGFDYSQAQANPHFSPGFSSDGVYDVVVAGEINNRPVAIATHITKQKKKVVYGPIKSIEARALTINGVLVDEIRKLLKTSKGKDVRKYSLLYKDVNWYNKTDLVPANVKAKCLNTIKQNAKAIGIMESYNEQLTEQTHGHWKVRAIVPGRGDITATVAGDQKSDRRYILGKFASKYMPRNDIGWWVDANEDKAIITWVPAKSSGKVLSPDNYIEWPAMNRPKQ